MSSQSPFLFLFLLVFHPVFPMLSETEESSARLISIAEHFRSDPNIAEHFQPAVLRSLVSNPDVLPLLPLDVLDQLLNDPIFNISLPETVRKEVTKLLKVAIEKEKSKNQDMADYEDYEYEDYNIYWGDYGDDAVNEFVKDLDPEFLKTISPSLLVSYFESASPEVIKSILANSSIIQNLPANTIGQLFQKLPQDLIVTVVNSEGVKDLYMQTAANLTKEEYTHLKSWQLDVSSQLIQSLDASVLAAMPEFLVKSQLNNLAALTTLIDYPAKLAALYTVYPMLLAEVSDTVITSLLLKKPWALGQVPESLLNSLLSCSLVEKLAATPGVDLITIVSTNTQSLSRILTDRPEILDCIPTNILSLLAITPAIINNIPSSLLINLVRRIPDSELEVLLSNSPILLQLSPDSLVSVIKADPRLLTRLPDSTLLEMSHNSPLMESFIDCNLVDVLSRHQITVLLTQGPLARSEVLLTLPLSSLLTLASDPLLVPLLSDSTILDVLSRHPLLLNLLPASILATLVRTRPWLLAQIPAPLVVTIAKRQEIFGLLTDQDLINILAFQPSVLTSLPEPTLVHLLQSRPYLLQSLPPSVEPVLVQLLKSRKLLSVLPISLVAKLASMPVVLRNLDKSSLLQVLLVHPSLPSLLPASILLQYLNFMTDPDFLLRVPCTTIAAIAAKPSLVESLPTSILESIVTSRRVLACIPTQTLEKLISRPELQLHRLPLRVLLRSARRLPMDKYSIRLVKNFFKNIIKKGWK